MGFGLKEEIGLALDTSCQGLAMTDKTEGRAMAEGGFVVKFDGKKPKKCYAVLFDYDERQYTLNNLKKKQIPRGTKKITIEIE